MKFLLRKSEVKFAPLRRQAKLHSRSELHCRRQLHLPQANLVVESACETHDTFNVGGDSKRSQNGLKTGGVIT